jgi:FMN phosphatase YigB (HAD superfamily)
MNLPEIPNDITVVAFDLGGILFENLAENFTYKRLERDFAVKEHDFENTLKPLYSDFQTGKVSEETFWHPASVRFNIHTSLLKEYYRQTVTAIPYMFDFLEEIKNKYLLYTLNTEPKEWMDFRIKHFDLDRYFKGYVTSGYIGAKKPDIKIYEAFIKKVKVAPQKVLFIDDVEGHRKVAEDLGFKTYKFNEIRPPLD